MKLVEALITGDKKHYEAVKAWVQQQKLSLNEKIWPLVRIILVDTEIHVEKKFRTIVLRQVLQQVEAGGCSPELEAMVSLLAPGRKTEKQLSLWVRAGRRRERLSWPPTPQSTVGSCSLSRRTRAASTRGS